MAKAYLIVAIATVFYSWLHVYNWVGWSFYDYKHHIEPVGPVFCDKHYSIKRFRHLAKIQALSESQNAFV